MHVCCVGLILKAEMNDSECLLINFHNEKDSIAVGFRYWMDEPVTNNELEEIIEMKQTVLMKWPNCNIEPASKMLKKVSLCKWKKCVGTILAAGSKYIYF